MNESSANSFGANDVTGGAATPSPGGLGAAQLEAAYEMIAEAIDRAGQGNEALFLAKLVLAMAHRAGDLDLLSRSLAIAAQDLPGSERTSR